MKNIITSFIVALKAEQIKKKGTGFYWTSAIIGLLSPVIYAIVTVIQNDDAIKNGIPYNLYLKFTENALQPFVYFFFPLLIIITVSRITQLDHRNGGWQLMETQPMTKFSIYFSKFTTLLIANLIAILSFVVFSILCAWLLTYVIEVPKMVTTNLPLTYLLQIITRLLVGSVFLTGFQFVLSVVIPSFIWTIIIGFFGLLLTAFLRPFNLIPVWYPYEILSNLASFPNGSDLGYWFTFTDYLGLICAIMVLYIGFVWYKNKQFKAAFFGKPIRTIALIVVLIVFGGLAFWVTQPNQMAPMTKTTLSGSVESKDAFQKVYLVNLITEDTIAAIPIKDKRFHFEFTKPVVADYYNLYIDNKHRKQLFFGTNDSIFVEVQLAGQAEDFKIKGTRLAENQVSSNIDYNWSKVEFYLEQNINMDKPDEIAESLYDEWEAALAKPSKFRTVDNYIPKQDFTTRSQKLVTVKYMNMWNQFLKIRAALYPTEKTVEGSNIKEIRKSLSLDDESLLSSNDYFEYVKSQMILTNKQDIDDNTKSLLAIKQLKESSFKDKMLFWQLKKSIEEASNTEERSQLMATYNSTFSEKNYERRIASINKMVESLGKGKEAPVFDGATIEGKTIALADLKGKFIVIDVWATWCAPCKRQSPFFEKFAIKYKKENIQFLALSVDQNMGQWFIQAKEKSKSVLQLHANDIKQFNKDYSIEGIPRFILIAPDGKFINARMPYPEDATFEIILRKEMNLPEE